MTDFERGYQKGLLAAPKPVEVRACTCPWDMADFPPEKDWRKGSMQDYFRCRRCGGVPIGVLHPINYGEY